MKCNACGGDNREGASFCRHCGARLAAPDAAEPPAVAQEAEAAQPAVEPAAVQAEAEALAAEAEGPAATLEEVEPGPGEGEKAEEAEAAPSPPELAPPGPIPPPAAEPEAAPLVPLPAGTVIADRYVLLEPQEVRPAEILYAGRDLCRCWQCGFANAPDDAFCAQCGASLERKPAVRLLQVQEGQAAPQDGAAVAERLLWEGRTLFVLAEAPPEGRARPAQRGLRLVIGQRSDVGQARELNEDSLLVWTLTPTYESRPQPLLGLFVVADGMGGHEGGEVASKLALQVLAQQVLQGIVSSALAGESMAEEQVAERLRQAVTAANDAVFLARQKRGNDMGTTLTAALVRDDRLLLAHVGDSRAYRWNADGLKQLTADHSLIAALIAAGRAAPEEIYTHPQRNMITRCIGDQPIVEVDVAASSLAPGDRLLLCSDGLWEMVHDEGIADGLMQEADPQAACDLLVRHANAAGGEDNITVIVVQAETDRTD